MFLCRSKVVDDSTLSNCLFSIYYPSQDQELYQICIFLLFLFETNPMQTYQNVTKTYFGFSEDLTITYFYFWPYQSLNQSIVLQKQDFQKYNLPIISNASNQKNNVSARLNQGSFEGFSKIASKKFEKKKPIKKRIQTKSRNNFSNILKSFVMAVKNNPSFRLKAKIIFDKMQEKTKFDCVIKKIRRQLPKSLNYVSPSSIKQIVLNHQNDDQMDHACKKLLRIMLRYFLKVEGLVLMSSQFKGKQQTSHDMIRCCRQLYRVMFDHV